MKVKIVNKSNNPLPAFQTPGSAGMDICAHIPYINDGSCDNLGFLNIKPGEIVKVFTGIFLEIPKGYECQVRSRSGLAAQGICVVNSPGTIDSDFRGGISILLINHNKYAFEINNGDRIAQLVFNKIEQPELELVEELSSTDRGEGGFGSTGK